MGAVRLDGIAKTFEGAARRDRSMVAVSAVTLDIGKGEFLVLVGPSGSGKSTVLRIIAGLELPTSGRVFIADRDVTDVAARDRNVAMVFQNYALYPHMSVRQNLGFALQMRKVPRAQIAERVRAVAASLSIEELLDRRPGALSGGQRQRVALGRACACKRAPNLCGCTASWAAP